MDAEEVEEPKGKKFKWLKPHLVREHMSVVDLVGPVPAKLPLADAMIVDEATGADDDKKIKKTSFNQDKEKSGKR